MIVTEARYNKGTKQGADRMKILRGLILLMISLLLGVGITSAQENPYRLVDLTDSLGASPATYAAVALRSNGLPAVALRESGAQFGTDRLSIRMLDGSAWTTLDTTPLLDSLSSQISEGGIDITFDANDNLIVALNRVVSDIGFDAYGTFVAQWDGANWSQVGNFVSDEASIGPIYLLNTGDSLALAWLTENSVHVSQWTGETWQPLGEGLPISQGAQPDKLFAAISGNSPVVVWTETFSSGETGLSLRGWNGSQWASLPDLPNQNDFQIGVSSLQGLTSTPNGTIYVASADESSDATRYVTAWQLSRGGWVEAGAPEQALESACAQNHGIAAGSDGILYYGWTADCRNALPITRWTEGQGWSALGEPVAIGNIGENAPPVTLNIAPDGTVFVGWLESGSQVNLQFQFAAYLPTG